MYRLLNIVFFFLVLVVTQSGLKVASAVATDGQLVERTPGKRVQIRPGQAENSFFKLQHFHSKAEMNVAQNPDAPFSPSVASFGTPSKTTPTLHDHDGTLHEKRAKTCPAQPLPSGHCTCSDQTLCTTPGSGSTCVKLETSHENCGSCFHRCGKDQACRSGTCICQGVHLSACGKACVDLSDNEQNCGRCGHACGKKQTCVAGRCIRL